MPEPGKFGDFYPEFQKAGFQIRREEHFILLLGQCYRQKTLKGKLLLLKTEQTCYKMSANSLMGKLLQNAPKTPKSAIWNPLVAVRRDAAETPKPGMMELPSKIPQLIFTDPATAFKNGVLCPVLFPGKLCPIQASSKQS